MAGYAGRIPQLPGLDESLVLDDGLGARIRHSTLGNSAMEFTLTQYFPAGLDRLWAVFSHSEYPQRKYSALGATALRLHRFHVTAQAIEVELERDVPIDPSRLPAWTRQLLGRQQTLRHRTQWRRVSLTQVSAELDITPLGLPVRAHGVGTLVETACNMTRMAVVWQVTSSLPLIGAKVERLFAHQLRMALEDDHAFTLKYLQQLVCGQRVPGRSATAWPAHAGGARRPPAPWR